MKILIAIFCLGVTAGIMLLAAVCICAMIPRIPRKSDCIIVLGARVWADGRMSNSLLYRCESAYDAWRRGIAPRIILCGGRVDKEPVAEAHAMSRWFAEQGVPRTAIHIDDMSMDTRENLNNARKIMEINGYKTAAVCTSDYHVVRALWLSRDAGISASAISAKSPSTLRSFVLGRCREAVGWVLYFLRII